jgi:peptidoglycan/xylan/chitin deacetylase (PgdA/CDA1 family)
MGDVLVLCYHAVSERWPAVFALSAERIERQVTALLGKGYVGATFRDAVLNPPAARTLAVTFDDAFRSVHAKAGPVLRSLGVPGTVFVPTALVGGEGPMAWSGTDRWLNTPYEDELQPMSWDELGELSELGWELGSHTRTHPRLPTLDRESLRDELEGSRSDLEQRIGIPCGSIAYPYGNHDPVVVAATRDAGYSAGGALAGEVQRADPLLVPRVGLYQRDGSARFRTKVSPATRRFQMTPAWRARSLLRRRR